MSATVAGDTPAHLLVVLCPGAIYSKTFQAQNPDGTARPWAAGTTALWQISDAASGFSTTWTGTVSGADMTFSATVAQVTAVPDGSVVQFYTDTSGSATAPVLSMSGRVVFRD